VGHAPRPPRHYLRAVLRNAGPARSAVLGGEQGEKKAEEEAESEGGGEKQGRRTGLVGCPSARREAEGHLGGQDNGADLGQGGVGEGVVLGLDLLVEDVLEDDCVDEGVPVEGKAGGDEDAADEGDGLPQVLVQQVRQLVLSLLRRDVVDAAAAARGRAEGIRVRARFEHNDCVLDAVVFGSLT
jgi:hypothetical protein